MNELINNVELNIRTNQWYNFPLYHMVAYIRVTSRYINDEYIKTIDLSTVEVSEAYMNKGFFTKFIQEIEYLAKVYSRTIYVESIINPILGDFLVRRGYHKLEHQCMYYSP